MSNATSIVHKERRGIAVVLFLLPTGAVADGC